MEGNQSRKSRQEPGGEQKQRPWRKLLADFFSMPCTACLFITQDHMPGVAPPTSCSLSSTNIPWHTCAHTHTHEHTLAHTRFLWEKKSESTTIKVLSASAWGICPHLLQTPSFESLPQHALGSISHQEISLSIQADQESHLHMHDYKAWGLGSGILFVSDLP